MPSVRIEMNHDGAEALLKGPEIRALLQQKADAIAAAAGGAPDYVAEVRVNSSRARGSVVTATFKAIRDEAEDRTLSRALDAGRR